jgi:stage V sporulation protein B
MIVYAVLMCLLNDRAMKKYMKYKNPWKSVYLYPLIASVPMAITAGVVYYGLYALIHSNLICLAVSIILAGCVYLFVYLLLNRPSEADIKGMPGGAFLYRLARKFHLC